MRKSVVVARILPAVAVLAVLALSFVAGGRVPFNVRLASCAGYGTGYGYVGQPTVTKVNPNAGPIGGGTSVTITGLGFCDTPMSVHFGATAATTFVVNADASLTAVSPAHVAGPVDVTVTTAGGTSATSSADTFTYDTFTYWFQWYDKASTGMANDNIHLLNTSGSAAHITVNLTGATSITVPALAAGAETYMNFPAGTIGGPVQVNSDQAILASQRVQFFQSFNEVWAESTSQALAVGHFSWYDKASTGFVIDNIHILNPGLTTSNVSVTVAGGTAQTVNVPAGGETYVTFPAGTIGGPVLVTVNSGPAVLASQRVEYYSTFNEVWAA